MKNNIVKIASIADIHFGKKSKPSELYNELKEEFIPVLEKFKPDIIEIAGDLYDSRQTMNSEAAIYCNMFISDINEFTKKGATVIVVHGTLSHDNNQIDSYNHYLSDNFRIYKKACTDIIHGLRYLILPEEYVSNQKEYYKDLMHPSTPHDKCVGHGMFKHAGGYVHESVESKSKSVVWDVKDFKNIVKGIVSFGHIHTSSILDNVIYIGSFSRFNFGESEPKGFYLIEHETNTGKSKTTFVENKKAPKYIDYEVFDKNSSIAIDDLRKLCSENDNVRVIPHLKSDNPVYQTIVGMCRELNNLYLHNKFVVRDNVIDLKEESPEQNIKRQKRDLYKDLHFIPATIMYAKNEFDTILTEHDIREALLPIEK